MDSSKKKVAIPIVIAVAIIGAATAALFSSGAQQHRLSSSPLGAMTANQTSVANPTTGLYSSSPSPTTTAGSADAATATTTTTSTTGVPTSPVAIKLSAKEEDETYRWSTSDGGINPSLKMTANTNNEMQIDNPTDAKHELVIKSSGKEVATSGDIAPNGSGHIAFKPTAPGTYEYYCEYHPSTMKGTIEVAASQ
jgi:plastocyanin